MLQTGRVVLADRAEALLRNEELRKAYRQETVAFPWETGDVLMLDNMLVAHGRESYSGPRKILAAMGEAYTRPSREKSKSIGSA